MFYSARTNYYTLSLHVRCKKRNIVLETITYDTSVVLKRYVQRLKIVNVRLKIMTVITLIVARWRRYYCIQLNAFICAGIMSRKETGFLEFLSKTTFSSWLIFLHILIWIKFIFRRPFKRILFCCHLQKKKYFTSIENQQSFYLF